MLGCYRLLRAGMCWNHLLLQLLVPRSGHNVPIKLQQDDCYSLFCNFLSLCEWKSAMPLKVRALRMGSRVYFRLSATFFYKRCRASMTKRRSQSTRVRAKGIEPIWSQVCSSRLRCQLAGWPVGLVSFLSGLPSGAEVRRPWRGRRGLSSAESDVVYCGFILTGCPGPCWPGPFLATVLLAGICLGPPSPAFSR